MMVMGMKNIIIMIVIKNMDMKGGDVLLSLVFNDKHSRSLQISAKHIVYRSLRRHHCPFSTIVIRSAIIINILKSHM